MGAESVRVFGLSSALVIAGLVLGGFGLGCQSRFIQPEQLPAEPIALLHWDDKAARSRTESFGKVAELPSQAPDRSDQRGADERERRAHLDAEVNASLARVLTKHPGRLKLYWPRTGKLERVEAAPLNSRPLAWSADHKRLLFVSSHRDAKEQLYEYNIERRDLSAVSFGPAEHSRGDYGGGDRLVLQSRRQSGRFDRTVERVYLASSGGRIEREIARDVPPGSLRFSPDGSRIVYEQVKPRRRTGGPTVFDSFVATWALAEGAEEQILAKGREPTLSPDGLWIVFASESSAGYRLRRMRPDGTSRVSIGPGGTEERMPTVSPDGEYIAFIQSVNGARRLAVRRFDGTSDRILMMNGWSEFPVW